MRTIVIISGVFQTLIYITGIVEGTQTNCSNGLVGVENAMSTVCCRDVCDFCGGSGCGSIPGTAADDCCASNIIQSGVYCNDSNEAPCILPSGTTSSSATPTATTVPVSSTSPIMDETQMTCSNGLVGVENAMSTVCCRDVCDFCGGSGCGSIPGTTADDCCASHIIQSGVYCNDSNEAPCILPLNITSSTATPTATTVSVESPAPIQNGPDSLTWTSAPTSTPSVASALFSTSPLEFDHPIQSTTTPQTPNITSEEKNSLSTGALTGIVGGLAGAFIVAMFGINIAFKSKRKGSVV